MASKRFLKEYASFLAYWNELANLPGTIRCNICGNANASLSGSIITDDVAICFKCFNSIRDKYQKYLKLRRKYERVITNTVYAFTMKTGKLRSQVNKAEVYELLYGMMRDYTKELKEMGITPEILFSGWWYAITGAAIEPANKRVSERDIITLAQVICKSLDEPDESIAKALLLP